ncbi:Uncharacterized protein APZ42_013791 [Daphnia magna]|uniref:Uncharacterized protein n=1 Tax=Daphnia magna TaxID=35525 RepID=A0A162QHV7_9CRUS|nr:Uncharacterized protein APZ42_013791 [Daphnia magna]
MVVKYGSEHYELQAGARIRCLVCHKTWSYTLGVNGYWKISKFTEHINISHKLGTSVGLLPTDKINYDSAKRIFKPLVCELLYEVFKGDAAGTLFYLEMMDQDDNKIRNNTICQDYLKDDDEEDEQDGQPDKDECDENEAEQDP